MFRWSYIVPRLLIVLAIVAFLRFGMNPLIQHVLVSSSQSVLGSKVEIGEVQASILDGDVYLSDISIADPRQPSKNILEAEHALLNFDRDALMHRKYVVTEGKLSGMRFATDRATDGSLDGVSQADVDARTAEMSQQLREFGERWLDAFADRLEADIREEFETVQVTEDLMRRWPKEYEQLNSDLARWKQNIENLERVYDEMRVNPLRSAEYYQRRLREIHELQQEIAKIRQEAERLHQQVQIDRKSIARAKRHDEQKIREALNVENFDPDKLSDYLLGEQVAQQVESALQWVQRGRHLLQIAQAKPTLDTPRDRGTVVPFSTDRTPLVLFQKLTLDGMTTHQQRAVDFHGSIRDVTSQPKLHGKPTSLLMVVRGALNLQVEATFDRTRDQPVDDFHVTCPSLAQPERTLGNRDRLALTMSPGYAATTVKLRLVDDRCEGTITLRQDEVRLSSHVADQFGGKRIAEQINGALFSVNTVDTRVHLSGEFMRPRVKIESNLGAALSAGINSAVREEMHYQTQRLVGQADARLSQEADRFDAFIEQREQALLKNLEGHETHIRRFQDLLAERFGGAATRSAKRLLENNDALKNLIFK